VKILLILLFPFSVCSADKMTDCINELTKFGIVGNPRSYKAMEVICEEKLKNEKKINRVKRLCELEYYTQLVPRSEQK
jgi:hypothetical protein